MSKRSSKKSVDEGFSFHYTKYVIDYIKKPASKATTDRNEKCMSTIQEVAKEAKVSVATVSRVLNNHPSVSPKTRRRVEEAIRRLQYEPNLLGRNLRRTESRLILVLVPTISNPFYSEIIQGIEEVAQKSGYNILLCTTGSDQEREWIYLDLVKQKLADGVISMDPAANQASLISYAQQFPVIQCCEYSEDNEAPYVAIDNRAAAYMAVKHLITSGHRKIALFNTDERFLYARLRKQGFLDALEEAGITPRSEWILNLSLSFEDGYRAMKEKLSAEDRPDALFAVSDVLAIGALRALGEAGLKSPEDMALVGFDNIAEASYTTPSLTTVGQPMRKMGQEACRMLIQRIEHQDKPVKSIFLQHELILRESTLGRYYPR